MNMVNANALQRVVLGYIETLPMEGPWDMIHVTNVKIIVIHAKGRKCIFLCFCHPQAVVER